MVTAAEKKAADEKAAADKAAADKKAADAKKDGTNDGDTNTVTKTDDGGNTQQVEEKDVEDTSISQPESPLQPRTVEGKDGIERLVEGPSDGWEPAQVDPTPAEIKASEDLAKAEEERKKRRTTEHPADRDNGND